MFFALRLLSFSVHLTSWHVFRAFWGDQSGPPGFFTLEGRDLPLNFTAPPDSSVGATDREAGAGALLHQFSSALEALASGASLSALADIPDRVLIVNQVWHN